MTLWLTVMNTAEQEMTVRNRLEKLEAVFVVVTLLLSTESFIMLIPHALRQVFWLSVYGTTALLLMVRWQGAIAVAQRAKLLWLLLGIVFLSIVWSDAPSVSIRQSVALMGTTLFGIYLATRYRLKEQLHLLGWVFGIAAVLSLIFAIALPSYGLQNGQSWQGIYHHKNLLGRIMALGVVTFLLNAQAQRSYRWLCWGGVALSTGLLLFVELQNLLGVTRCFDRLPTGLPNPPAVLQASGSCAKHCADCSRRTVYHSCCPGRSHRWLCR